MNEPILIDVDGVCADFIGQVISTNRATFTHADVKCWGIFDLFTSAEQRFVALKRLDDPEWWRTMPVIEGAAAAVRALRAVAPVVFVTAPWVSCPAWCGARRAWLREHFACPGDVVITHRKEMIRGRTLIDDRVEHVIAWQEANPERPSWLYDQPYNRGNTIPRLAGWAEVLADPAGFVARDRRWRAA